MKTAISLPDDVYDRATRSAQALGISRSELFAVAVAHYLDERERASVTALIDAALDRVADDDSNDVAVAAGRSLLDGENW